jgi:transcriptional regulator with XRE-family HTH domain
MLRSTEIIRQLREDHGWSDTKIAEAAGVTRNYIWMLRTGSRSNVCEDVLERLAASLRKAKRKQASKG